MKRAVAGILSSVCIAFVSATALAQGTILTAPVSIDSLQEALFKGQKRKAAEDAGKAFDALEAKNWKQARALGVAIEKSDYRDYGLWMQAEADLREAEALAASGKKADALRLAERAVPHFRQIETVNPYSPWIRETVQEIGKCEVLMGLARTSDKSGASAQGLRDFERGFQRLVQSGELGELNADAITAYGKACMKVPGLLCRPWSQRIAGALVRGSEPARALLKAFPEAANRVRFASPDRKTRSYRSTDMDITAFDAALNHYWDGDTQKAIEAFQRFMDEFPKSIFRFRARYWLAQSLKKQHDPDRARIVLTNLQLDSPLTYYGLLSSLETGLSIDHGIDATLPLALSYDPQLFPLEQYRLRRGEELLRAGANELAATELKDIRPRDALSSPFLMYLAVLDSLAGNHVGSFNIINELLQRGYEHVPSSFVMKLVFPQPLADLVEKYSRENDLDPILVLSLIKQESSFDCESRSGSGALGLMQLMPATAFETLPSVARSELQTREANLRVGTRYLKQLMDRFKGNIVYSLAGYNAGPGAVDRWQRQVPAERTMLEFIESIPYRETREYVASIIRNYYWYSKRFGLPVKPLNYFWAGR